MEGDPLDGRDREEEFVRCPLGRSRGWSGGGGSVAMVAEEMREVLCCAVLSLAGWLAAGPATKGNAASKQVSERGERADSRQTADRRLRAQHSLRWTHADKAALLH